MSSDDNNIDDHSVDEKHLDQDLLDDSDFAELMSAEFEAAGRPEDRLATKRAWSGIEEKISTLDTRLSNIDLVKNKKKQKNQFMMKAFAAAAVLALAVTGIVNQNSGNLDRLKGENLGVPVTVVAKKIEAASADTFKFSVNVSQDSWSLLLKKHGMDNWEIVSNTFECKAGIECSVDVGIDLVYGFESDDSEKTEFCGLASKSNAELDVLVASFLKVESGTASQPALNSKSIALSESACIFLEKGREPYR